MKIATLSSRKLGDSYEGSLKNNYLYRGAYSELDDDIGWNDFALRDYDAQTGRWVQQDPFQQFASPYLGMGDDPVNNTDPTGGVVPPIGGLSTTAESAITLSNVVLPVLGRVTQTIGASNHLLTITSSIFQVAYSCANIINLCNGTDPIRDLFINPLGKPTYLTSKNNVEYFNGEAFTVGKNKVGIQPMSGTVKAFTKPSSIDITRENDDNVEQLRFVATFNDAGRFLGYAWEKDLSYTYEKYVKDAAEDVAQQRDNLDNPLYQHYDTPKEAGMAALKTGMGVVLPTMIVKGATTAANASKTGTQTTYTFTKSAAEHLNRKVQRGENAGQLARPYMRSPLTIQEIMSTGKGTVDATFKGGMNWRVPGIFRGSEGFWELGINPETNVIYHFNFVN